MSNSSRALMTLFATLAVASIATAAAGPPDVKLISQGREVTLEEHLVPGKLVVFDFFADWCAPCRYLTPHLERLAEEHPDRLALRKIDVIDWSSPVARQHGLSAIPHLVLFGADGARLAEGDAQRVLAMLESQLGGAVGDIPAARGGSKVPAPVWLALGAVLVTSSLLLRRRGRTAAVTDRRELMPAVERTGGSPQIWFAVVQGNLAGPYSVEQLADLRRSGGLDGSARVRRRGDATWRSLDDVVGSPGDR